MCVCVCNTTRRRSDQLFPGDVMSNIKGRYKENNLVKVTVVVGTVKSVCTVGKSTEAVSVRNSAGKALGLFISG